MLHQLHFGTTVVPIYIFGIMIQVLASCYHFRRYSLDPCSVNEKRPTAIFREVFTMREMRLNVHIIKSIQTWKHHWYTTSPKSKDNVIKHPLSRDRGFIERGGMISVHLGNVYSQRYADNYTSYVIRTYDIRYLDIQFRTGPVIKRLRRLELCIACISCLAIVKCFGNTTILVKTNCTVCQIVGW